MAKRWTRRRLVSTLGAAASVGLAGCSDSTQSDPSGTPTDTDSTPTTSEESTPTEDSPEPESEESAPAAVDSHLSDVDNYDGTIVDARGQETVTVEVGVAANGGPFGFGPAAVHVDPGTTVQWEWTGEGGAHNVVSAEDGPLDSGSAVASAGVNYEFTFEADGVYNYVCTPHEGLGMKGSVVVGDVDATGEPTQPDDGASAPATVDSHLSGVDNYDGTVVDETGQDTVTVEVGVQANGGAYGFGPAAVHVDPGTTVQWEWTGEGGGHNVVSAEDGPLDSGSAVSSAGVNYEFTFEEDGVYNYVCVPHEALGMKGSVVVGDE